jgi:hypothetical protein
MRLYVLFNNHSRALLLAYFFFIVGNLHFYVSTDYAPIHIYAGHLHFSYFYFHLTSISKHPKNIFIYSTKLSNNFSFCFHFLDSNSENTKFSNLLTSLTSVGSDLLTLKIYNFLEFCVLSVNTKTFTFSFIMG